MTSMITAFTSILSSRNLKLIFSVGLTLGVVVSGIFYGLKNGSKHQSFTRAEFERLYMGSSLTQVEAILGRGIKIQQSQTKEVFTWKNLDGSNITVELENNKLIQKTQEGLR